MRVLMAEFLSLAAAAAGQGGPNAPFDAAHASVVLGVHATGAQVYECRASAGGLPAWVLREPIATLIKDGRTVGRHFAGPAWELDDGSRVTGKPLDSVPGATANDIPQLKLQVVAHQGHGLLDKVTVVYRLQTAGGQLKGACGTAGELRAVPYAADYLFAR